MRMLDCSYRVRDLEKSMKKSKWLPIALCALLAVACGNETPGEDNNGTTQSNNGTTGGKKKPPVSTVDTDMDGLTDVEEAELGSDPNNPDTDGDGLNDGLEVEIGTDPTKADTDGDGRDDKQEIDQNTDPTVADELCDTIEGKASAVKKPVDIIIVVDNSGSMTGEAAAIRTNLNGSLGTILDQSGIDYRVIMVARYGNSGTSICIAPPLGQSDCTAGSPGKNAKYAHCNKSIASRNALSKLEDTYSEGCEEPWGLNLRPEAFKSFLAITDDNERMEAQSFDDFLMTHPEQFGTVAQRNYTFHSIVGLAENTPATAPWPASSPFVDGRCMPGSVNNGSVYQDLSILTGGLRFPICKNDNFDKIFEALAADVIARSAIPCSYASEAEDVDLSKAIATYTPGDGGAVVRFPFVQDEASCTASGGYYVLEDAITLCPSSCEIVDADEAGEVKFEVGCGDKCGNGVIDFGENCDDGNTQSYDGCSQECIIELG